MTRGWVCRLELQLDSPAKSFYGPSPVGLMIIFYCLRTRDFPNLEVQVPIFISRWSSVYSLSTDRIQNTTFIVLLLLCLFLAEEMCLPRHCPAMAVTSCSSISALSHHVIVFINLMLLV
jgi:hypothetical protein